MRYVEILHEGRTQQITMDDFLANRNKCSLAIEKAKNGQKIYRGADFSGEFGYLDPSTNAPRRSANTENYYTALMDGLPSWANMPSRSRGVICTTSTTKANVYGKTYIMLPIGNPDIGVCSTHDFWDSFDYVSDFYRVGDDMLKFNKNLNRFALLCDVVLDDTSYETMKKSLEEIDENIPKLKWSVPEIWTSKGTVLVTLNDMLDPVKNNIKKVPLSEFAYFGQSVAGKEVWFSAPAFCVEENVFNGLENQGKL